MTATTITIIFSEAHAARNINGLCAPNGYEPTAANAKKVIDEFITKTILENAQREAAERVEPVEGVT